MRSTISTSGARAPHRLLAGKRKANELASSGDSPEPATRRPAPDAGSAPVPANSSEVTGEHADFAAGTSYPPKEGRRTRLSWPGPPRLIREVGRSSPQPWIQARLNPLSRPKQSIGACLATCPGLWAARRMAPLQTPRWPTPACPQGSVLIRLTFLF